LHEADVDLAWTIKSLIPISSLLTDFSTSGQYKTDVAFRSTSVDIAFRRADWPYSLHVWPLVGAVCVLTDPKLTHDVRSIIIPYNGIFHVRRPGNRIFGLLQNE
jgi:hypothetical protein